MTIGQCHDCHGSYATTMCGLPYVWDKHMFQPQSMGISSMWVSLPPSCRITAQLATSMDTEPEGLILRLNFGIGHIRTHIHMSHMSHMTVFFSFEGGPWGGGTTKIKPASQGSQWHPSLRTSHQRYPRTSNGWWGRGTSGHPACGWWHCWSGCLLCRNTDNFRWMSCKMAQANLWDEFSQLDLIAYGYMRIYSNDIQQ